MGHVTEVAGPGAVQLAHDDSEFPDWLYQRNVSLLSAVPADMLPMVLPHWRQYPAPLPGWHTAIGVIYTVIGVLATVGNSIALCTFTTAASLRSRASHLMASLTVSDLGMTLTQIPLLVANSFSHHWVAPVWMCEVYGFCGGLFGTASILSLAMIALERRAALGSVSKFTTGWRMTVSRVLFIWLFSAVWMGLPFLGVSRFVAEGFMTSCTFDYISNDAITRTYIGLSIVVCYLVPLAIVVFCYYGIYKILQQLPLETFQTKAGIPVKTLRESQMRRKELQLTRAIITLVTAWCLSWTPYTVAVLLGMAGSRRLTPFVSVACAIFAKSSAVYNPFIYGLAHQKFRKALSRKCKHWPRIWRKVLVQSTSDKSRETTGLELRVIRRSSVVIRRGRLCHSASPASAGAARHAPSTPKYAKNSEIFF